MRFAAPVHARQWLDVTQVGARGDGRTLDHDAINRAIAQVAYSGGGTVALPAGRYLCFSIRLASGVALWLAGGAVIEAADPGRHGDRYDDPEPRGEQLYQDFGHSHWHNSLIWGDGLHDIAIAGPGRIEGRGLTRNGPGSRWRSQRGERPLSMRDMSTAAIAALEPEFDAMRGQGNKAIGLRDCHGVTIEGLTIDRGGHIAVLLTGCTRVSLDRLTIDAERDGIDLDGVRHATVTHCRVNTPNDDAIVIKSSLAMGHPMPVKDIVIRDCAVSGYDRGTMLDGRFGTAQLLAPDRDGPTGRIKIGTESNGGFRDILIEDCRFDHSRGLALETVDGGVMENVTARRLTMHDVTSAPVFLRLGNRGRGPEGTGIGSMRGITLADVVASDIDYRYPAIIAGSKDRPVRDVTIARMSLHYRGGGTAGDGEQRPGELPDAYPEPSMFGTLPAWGLWARHVEGLEVEQLSLSHDGKEGRRPILLDQVRQTVVRHTPLWP
ncbi:rhamnogalacturonidase [Sphingomonas fuzhouensis]|uniref:rhamnogalacturonidase n=1 Tax=Sphingomonas fuzhouensis TaxID=3106033 RepID=UPI002AFE2E6C|nr:glycosyl hydrolase family 28-related protein [Sphingomonas sp. SGZ-02]